MSDQYNNQSSTQSEPTPAQVNQQNQGVSPDQNNAALHVHRRKLAMANSQQLDLLKQGVNAWNAWRQTHLDIQPDLKTRSSLPSSVIWHKRQRISLKAFSVKISHNKV